MIIIEISSVSIFLNSFYLLSLAYPFFISLIGFKHLTLFQILFSSPCARLQGALVVAANLKLLLLLQAFLMLLDINFNFFSEKDISFVAIYKFLLLFQKTMLFCVVCINRLIFFNFEVCALI